MHLFVLLISSCVSLDLTPDTEIPHSLRILSNLRNLCVGVWGRLLQNLSDKLLVSGKGRA
jgi:hypothetical protein